jgi:lipid-binding SYLF domain-containing protein
MSLVSAKEKADETAKRLTDATAVVADAKSMGIAKDLFEKGRCAIIIPNMKKGGFLVAAQYGKGFVSCKDKSNKFTSLSAIKLEGGSFGLQAGRG